MRGFVELQGSSLAGGRQILAEAEQTMLHLREVSATDLETFNCNKALLLLALGQPDRAYGVLASTSPGRLRDTAAAYSAIALNRMGRVREALAVLMRRQGRSAKPPFCGNPARYIKTGKHFADLSASQLADEQYLALKVRYSSFLTWTLVSRLRFTDAPEPFVSFHCRQGAGGSGKRHFGSSPR